MSNYSIYAKDGDEAHLLLVYHNEEGNSFYVVNGGFDVYEDKEFNDLAGCLKYPEDGSSFLAFFVCKVPEISDRCCMDYNTIIDIAMKRHRENEEPTEYLKKAAKKYTDDKRDMFDIAQDNMIEDILDDLEMAGIINVSEGERIEVGKIIRENFNKKSSLFLK